MKGEEELGDKVRSRGVGLDDERPQRAKKEKETEETRGGEGGRSPQVPVLACLHAWVEVPGLLLLVPH